MMQQSPLRSASFIKISSTCRGKQLGAPRRASAARAILTLALSWARSLIMATNSRVPMPSKNMPVILPANSGCAGEMSA